MSNKILIIDDDEIASATIDTLLSAKGYDTVVVNESKNALEIALRELPDLICLDLMMPQPDGFTLAMMIRGEATLTRTPIVVITALDHSGAKADAFRAGANEYLAKPFNRHQLYGIIQDMFHRKELGLFDSD